MLDVNLFLAQNAEVLITTKVVSGQRSTYL